MPEGPEARAIADELRLVLPGKYIHETIIEEKATQIGLDRLVMPVQILSVDTYGKKILFRLANGQTIVTSLGMQACWFIEKKGKHSSITLLLKDQQSVTRIYFNNVRFGKIILMDELVLPKGPDLLQHALTSYICAVKWNEILRRKGLRRRQIVKVLLDQDIVAGIGNYLKCEILYESRIAPHRTIESMSDHELEIIRIMAHRIILTSYMCGGLTISTYLTPSGRPGRYPRKVYRRPHDPNGYVNKMSYLSDGRTTYWTPELQY